MPDSRYITPDVCIRDRLRNQQIPVWPAALMVFRDKPGSAKVLDALVNVRPVSHGMLYNSCGPDLTDGCVFTADLDGREILVLTRCVWGGPQTAILVEELACLGIQTIVGYGIAGSMVPALKRGRMIAGVSGLPTDGTTRAYGFTQPVAADRGLLEAAMRIVGTESLAPATVATVDALYRETPDLIDSYRANGAQVVNLETSPLYASACSCNVRSLWLGYVSDHLFDREWHDWYLPAGQVADETVALCKALLSDALS